MPASHFADFVAAAVLNGRPYHEIGKEIDLSAEAIRSWWRRNRWRYVVTPTPPLDPTRQQRKDALTNERLDALAPIVLPAPAPVTISKTPANITVVAGDFHFGLDSYSEPCEEIFLRVVQDLRPKKVILNGDLPDMLAVSNYPKDVRLRIDLLEERKQMLAFLVRLHEITASWGAELVETNSNHSGESQESRWWRYLSARIPELLADKELQERLSYKAIWHPPWSRVRVVDYEPICSGLIALHGDIVRTHAAYTAKAMLEKWRHNLIHGHTHRLGATGYRVPGIAGQKEHQMRAFEGGCMCSLSPTYESTSAPNWQNGFVIVFHMEDQFGIEQVLINNGQATVACLGATYKASE